MLKKYVFDDFVLSSSGKLTFENKTVSIPPKELSVLIALLEAEGSTVSKDELIKKVWLGCNVSEESLTRCIYSIRRILKETKGIRYIETVYGKGYRFLRPVALVANKENAKKVNTVAISPFRYDKGFDQNKFHSELVRWTSRYSIYGLNVLPAALTCCCTSIGDLIPVLEEFHADYYLSGQVRKDGDKLFFDVEFVQVDGHKLLSSECIECLEDNYEFAIKNELIGLFPKWIPALHWCCGGRNTMDSVEVAMTYLNGCHQLQRYTPSSLIEALTLLRHCISLSPNNFLSYCSLAECYFLLSQLGMFDQKIAMKEAQSALSKAIELNPNAPKAIALLALLSSLRSDVAVAEALFEHARLLEPDSIDIKYYYSWHLFLSGNLTQAQALLETCLSLDHSRPSINILKIWIMFYDARIEEAIIYGNGLLLGHCQDHPVLKNIMALFLSMTGDKMAAENMLCNISPCDQGAGILLTNECYVKLSGMNHGRDIELQRFLNSVDSRYIKASLLPIIYTFGSKKHAAELWEKLEQENYHWLSVWRHDPRLKELQLLSMRET